MAATEETPEDAAADDAAGAGLAALSALMDPPHGSG